MDYFKDCKTHDDVKRLYRELAMKLHPDHGGNATDMIELTKQYETWTPSNRFERSSTLNEDEFEKTFKKSSEEWGKEFEKAKYGGFGGYRFNTVNDMKREYFNQRNDPRLAEYERMKHDYEFMKKNYDPLKKLNTDQRFEILDLVAENNTLKKKLLRLKKRLEKLSTTKKVYKKHASSSCIAL